MNQKGLMGNIMACILLLCIGFSISNLSGNNLGLKGKPIHPRYESVDTIGKIKTCTKVPSLTGELSIDGAIDDEFWQSACIMPLENTENSYFGEGGEVRVGVHGKYLCMSAKIPYEGRLVARSTGINPVWEREDMVAWRLKYKSPVTRKTVFAVLAVNPYGAVSLFSGDSHYYGTIGDDVINSRKRLIGIHGVAIPSDEEFINSTGTLLPWIDDIISTVVIGEEDWSVELGLPLEQLGTICFMSIERVRAPRPNEPALSWFWPAENVRGYLELPEGNMGAPPAHYPSSFPPENTVIKTNATPETLLAKEVAALPKYVWTKEEQKLLGVDAMQQNSIQVRMSKAAEDEKQAWLKVQTLDDWKHFRDKRLRALREWLGPFPVRTPLRPKVTRRTNFGDGFIIENIVFESRPHLIVTANLYLPEYVSTKIPAVVVVHGHHAPKTQIELQDLGMTWARSGTAVLIMDQINGGERSQSQPWVRESYYGRYATGNQLYLAGESLIKWMAWDIMRGIDVLLERPYVDPDRIVLLGAVAGGGDPVALTANLDPRIAAVIPFNFGEASPEAHYLEGPRKYDNESANPGQGYWETTRDLPHSVSDQFFPWFLCAAGAPRPFIFSFEMAWPKTVEEKSIWSRYKKVYSLFDARENLAEVDGLGSFPGPGETNQVSTYLRQSVDPILHKWLDIPIPLSEYHNLRPERELMCLTPATAIEYKPESVAFLAKEIALERLASARSKRASLSKEQQKQAMREELKEKLGDIKPEMNPLVQNVWIRNYAGFKMEASTVEIEEGITIPVFLLIPKNGSKRFPVVMGLAQGGKEGFLSERSNEIALLLKNGITVCLPDLRATGELTGSISRGPAAMSLTANELMLGGTMTGSRLKDARTIFHWLANRTDIDPKKMAVWGESFSDPNGVGFNFDQSPGQKPGPIPQRQVEPLGPFLAILTALYEDQVSAVAGSGGLVSFLSVLEDRFCHIPQDVIVPGLLEVTDLGEIVAFIGPRPVLLEGMVDGRNKQVSLSRMEKEYDSKEANVLLRENGESPSIAQWISHHMWKM